MSLNDRQSVPEPARGIVARARRWLAAAANPRVALVAGAAVLGIAIQIPTEAVVRDEIATSVRSVDRQTEAMAKFFRDHVSADFEAVETLLFLAEAELPPDRVQPAPGRLDRLAEVSRTSSALFGILDAEGRMIWSSKGRKLPADLVLEHLAAHRSGSMPLHVSAARPGPETGQHTAHLSHAIKSADGRLLGLAIGAIDVAAYRKILVDMNLGTGSLLQLVRRDGVVVVRVADGAVSSGQRLGGDDWKKSAAQDWDACRTGISSGEPEGNARVSSYCSAGSYALTAGLSIDRAQALSGSQLTVLRYRVVGYLLIGLLAGGTMIMLALLTRQQMTQIALRQSEARFRALNALGSDWYWETDAEYRLTRVSEGLVRLSGRAETDYLGIPIWEAGFVTPVGSDWSLHKAGIARAAPFRDLCLRYVSPQGVVSYGSLSGEPVFEDETELKGYRGVGNDVSAEIMLRQRLRMQHDVTRALNQAASVDEAVKAVLAGVCSIMDWSWGAHRKLDRTTQMATCASWWSAPGEQLDAFRDITLRPAVKPNVRGILTRAIQSQSMLWESDTSRITTRRQSAVVAAGLRAALVVPIPRHYGEAEALEFFSKRIEVPDVFLKETLEAITREVGQYIDRVSAEQATSRLQRERRHLLDMLQLQLDHMPIACLITDRHFKVIYCNPAAERVFGYSSEEFHGRDTVDYLVPESSRPIVLERRARLQAGDRTVGGLNENITKDGRTIICEWGNTPLNDEAGVFTGALAVAQDVTERTRMVAALEDSEERYRQIFAAAPLPMWVADVPIPRFLAVNDAAVLKYGYSREEMLAMSAIDLQLPEDRDSVQQDILSRDPALPRQFFRRHRTHDGQVILAEVTAQPFQFGGKPARLIVVNDVTERLRSQRALEDSEARFRAVFEQASVGIGIRDISLKPRWLRVNRKLCEILGYSEAELLQMTSLDVTPESDRSETQVYNQRLRTGEVRAYSRQKRYQRKDGRLIWVELSIAVVDGPDGQPLHLVSVVQDITEAVESRQLLKESEARYRQIFAMTPMPMTVRSEETLKFIEVNDAWLQTYGYTREEAADMSATDIQDPAERDNFRRVAESRQATTTTRLHKRHRRKNGEIFDVEIHSFPTMLGTQRVRVSLIRDMTEQMHSEQLLRESERRVALALEGSAGALFDWNIVTGDIYLSERWNVMLGGESRETHTSFAELEKMVHPEDRDIQRAAIVRLLKGGGVPQQTELRVRTHAGHWLWIESRGGVTEQDAQGRALRVLGTNIDITHRKNAELVLRERDAQLRESTAEIRKLNAELEQRVEQRTRALAAANRELESFSYSVSHDLRAPLRTIDGFSQILLQEYADLLDSTGRGYLERVRAGSQRMAQLIDDLLELARVTRRDLQIRHCDLTTLCSEIAREIQNTDPARKIRLSIADGMAVMADPGLLRIALDNLLRNAWKFTSLKPDAAIEIGQIAGDTGPTYFVRDNGVGFDMTYVNKLFGAFQRLHSEAEFQGTGIGLALVQRVIRRHGGQVWAEAQPGQGATFFFTLPEQPPTVLPAAAALPMATT